MQHHHQRTNKKRKNFPLKYLFHSKSFSGENNCDWEKQFHHVWNPYIDLSTICIASYSSDINICLCMIGKNLEACDWPVVLLLNSQPGHNWWELSVYYQLAFLLCGGKKTRKQFIQLDFHKSSRNFSPSNPKICLRSFGWSSMNNMYFYDTI